MAQLKLPKVPKPHVRKDNSIEMRDPMELVLIHLAVNEAQALDALQGGEDIGEDGLRSYAKLGPIFEEPEVRAEFERVHAELDEGKPEAETMYEVGQKVMPPFQSTPGDNVPSIQDVEDLGMGGDALLVWMPKNVLLFLSSITGGLRKNPNTGLFALGGVGSAVKNVGKAVESIGRGVRDTVKNPGNFARTAVAVVGGGLLGGPVGALGATLGHLHGQGHGNKGFGSALTGFRMGKLGEFGLNALGYQLPLMGGVPGFGSLTNGMNHLGQMGAQAGSQMGLPQTSAQHGFIGSLGQGIKNGTTQMMNQTPGQGGLSNMLGAKSGGPSGVGGMLSSPFLMAGIQGVLSHLGEQQNYKREKEEYERQKRDRDEMLARSGLMDRWTPPSALNMRRTAYSEPTTEEFKYGRVPSSPAYSRYASGGHADERTNHAVQKAVIGLVKGPGKGQADKIKTSVPEGSYIIDATSVSMLGDGSSEAGAHALEEGIREARKKAPHAASKRRAGGNLPVYLSNDEYAIAPHDVAAFGDGNEDRGAYILKGMVKELRSHKNSNGDRLPPRAKDVWKYIKMSKRGGHASK